MDSITRVYDQNMKKLTYLQNAFNVGYDLTLNALWMANFSLPADDPKNIYCQPFNYVEIFDGKERIELFRIMPSRLTRDTKGNIVYNCEHVLATLIDDVMFKYHQIGGDSIGTVQVLRYILDHQTTPRWQLQQCDFDRRFEYKWENENLLAALFSVPQVFDEGYRWEFDTTGTIWRVSLKRLPEKFKADITYKKNMLEIQKESDPTNVVTRLYCLGYGEGDNQLGIESVNGGVPYLQANTTTYGIKASILVDRRFESAETLKAYGQSILNELKNPYKSYQVQAVDLHRKSPEKYERFFPGDIVRVIDKEDDIVEDMPIVAVKKSDIRGNPGAVTVEVGNRSRDIAGSINELASRTRINEVYAQGATNQMMIPFADNADPDHPAVMKVYIPDTMVRINKCILNFQLESFRAYSKAVAGGGAGARTTSEGGGGFETTSNGGHTSSTVRKAGRWFTDSGYTTGMGVTDIVGRHNHGIPNGTELKDANGRSFWFAESGNHDHIINANHDHQFEIPDHSHSISFEPHSHNINLPSHTHDLEFGIYQGETADTVSIKVDGNTIQSVEEGEDINIVPYMSVDSSGKIDRNTWHTIEIIPDKMTRIAANIFLQIFTQSRGGGDY